MSEGSLRDKAVSGAIWKLITILVNYSMTFVVELYLARKLEPSDYGLVGMLTIFFAIAGVLVDSGFSSALVQRQNRTDADFSTVFVFNIVASVCIYGLFVIFAPSIAAFYNEPLLKTIIYVSALSFIIKGLTSIHFAKLNIDLRFSTLSKISLVGHFAAGITGVLLAYMGFGIWALVFQGIASALITGIIVWICSGLRPSIGFSRRSFSSLFSYGGNMLGSGIINVIYGNMYTLVIGKGFSSADVGFYNRANGYACMPSNIVTDIALRVNFPILVKLQNDNERLISAYEKLLTVPFFILYPVLVGVIVCAEPLITVVIGEKWLPCVPYMRILCVGYMFYPLNGFNMNILYAKGRTDISFKLEFIKKPIGLLLLFASLPFGIIWMMVGKALYSLIVYFINCYYTNKIVGYGLSRQIKILLPMLGNSLVMGLVVFLCMRVVSEPATKLLVGIPVGMACYLLMAYVRNDDSLSEIMGIVKNKFRGNK